MAKQPTKRKTNKKMTDTTASTPRTLEQKIAATELLLEKYRRELVAEKIKNDIAIGDDVDFTFGRGETKRTMTGVVAGLKDTDQGKIVGVTVTDEDGFPEVKRVNIRDLTANRTADQRRANAPTEGGPDAASDPLEHA